MRSCPSGRSGIIRPVACLIALGALSGCGGGSGSDGGRGDRDKAEPVTIDGTPPPPTVRPLPATPVRAVLVLERRGDKLLADGWIEEPVTSTPPDVVSSLWTDGEESCSRQRVIAGTGTATGKASFDGGERMTVTGRAEDPLILDRQQAGERVAYATDARWRVEPLPDDAVLALPDELSRRGLAGVPLRPQTPLVWEAPTNGHLKTLGTTMRWAGSPDADDRMVLWLSSWRPNDDKDVVRVRCEVLDDGEFRVPEPVDIVLSSTEGGALVSGMRLRETHASSTSGDRLTVVQSAKP